MNNALMALGVIDQPLPLARNAGRLGVVLGMVHYLVPLRRV